MLTGRATRSRYRTWRRRRSRRWFFVQFIWRTRGDGSQYMESDRSGNWCDCRACGLSDVHRRPANSLELTIRPWQTLSRLSALRRHFRARKCCGTFGSTTSMRPLRQGPRRRGPRSSGARNLRLRHLDAFQGGRYPARRRDDVAANAIQPVNTIVNDDGFLGAYNTDYRWWRRCSKPWSTANGRLRGARERRHGEGCRQRRSLRRLSRRDDRCA